MSASADISKLINGLGEYKRRALEAGGKGLTLFAWHVIGDSQHLCPIDTGALAASGTVGELEWAGETFTITLGHNTDYAAVVHERLDLHHEQGQAKYLETSFRNNQPKLVPFVGEKIREAVAA